MAAVSAYTAVTTAAAVTVIVANSVAVAACFVARLPATAVQVVPA